MAAKKVRKGSKIKKKAREDAAMDFNFSDAFDEAEKMSRLAAVEVTEKIDLSTVIPSGSLMMDLMIYGGGIQAGRIYDLHGEESGGKTTSGTIILVQAIKYIPGPLGKTKAYYIDAEGTLDRKWFKNIMRAYGVKASLKEIFGKKDDAGEWEYKPTVRLLKPTIGDTALKTLVRVLNCMPDKVFIKDTWMYSWTPVEPKVAKKTGGLTVKKLQKLLESKGIVFDKTLFNKTGSFMVPVPNNYGGPELIILIDSIAALTPAQTAEDDSGAFAQQGRMFSRWMNTLKSLAAAKGVTFININQLRTKPGVTYGDPRYAPGGSAVHYVADCRNYLTPSSNPAGGGQYERDGKDEYRWTTVANKKNKLFMPGAKFKFRWWTQRNGKTGCGLDPVLDTMDFLESTGQILEKGRKGFYIRLVDHQKAKSVLDDLLLNVDSFKELIVNGEIPVGKGVLKCNLRKICRDQIQSGIAFELARKFGRAAAKKKEEVVEDDE